MVKLDLFILSKFPPRGLFQPSLLIYLILPNIPPPCLLGPPVYSEPKKIVEFISI